MRFPSPRRGIMAALTIIAGLGLASVAQAVPMLEYAYTQEGDTEFRWSALVMENDTIQAVEWYWNGHYLGYGGGRSGTWSLVNPPAWLQYGVNELWAIVDATDQMVGPVYIQITPGAFTEFRMGRASVPDAGSSLALAMIGCVVIALGRRHLSHSKQA